MFKILGIYNYLIFFIPFLLNVFVCSMSIDFTEFDKFKIEAYKNLTDEQQKALSPARYDLDKTTGRIIIHLLADKIVKNLYVDQDVDLTDIINSYSAYLIDLRESVLSSDEIKVIDKNSAQARAAQMLTRDQMNAISKESYISNRNDAFRVIVIFADHMLDVLIKYDLISKDSDYEKFKKDFVESKVKELDLLYNINSN